MSAALQNRQVVLRRLTQPGKSGMHSVMPQRQPSGSFLNNTVGRLLTGAVAFGLLVCLSAPARAADWPQWRGPLRDGSTTETIGTNWPGGKPVELWSAEVGRGHAPVCVADGRTVTLGHTGEVDTVWCFDAAKGDALWRFDYPAIAHFKDEAAFKGAYDGPQAAPLIQDGRIYTLSRDGKVHCLEAATGALVWKRDLLAELKAKPPECGFASSPLIAGGLLVVGVGAAGTALDPATGDTRWQSGADIAGYAAPVLVPDKGNGGRLLLFACKDLVSVNLVTGEKSWSLPWPTQYGVNVADPIVVGDAAFISSAYDRGCASVELATGAVRWQNKAIRSQCSPLILSDGCLYGFDGYINYGPGGQALVCLDPSTGQSRWRQDGMAGQLIRAGDRLVVLLITGDLVIVRASPKSYEELARARVAKPEECPVTPALAGGRLYVRTGAGRLTCFAVAER